MRPHVDTKLNVPLRAYLTLLDHWNRIHSLTALPQAERWEELVLDSAALLPLLEPLPTGSRVGDFGTGMGMPAILLALARPDLQILALDKSKKKLAFVRQACLELGLKNLQTLHGRFEAIPPLGLDAGVAKALAPLRDLQTWWERHGTPQAPFLALKSLDDSNEPTSPGWHFMESAYELPTRGQRRVIQMTKGA